MVMTGIISRTTCIYLLFYKDPNLSPWKGKQVVKYLKKKKKGGLYKSLEGYSGKKVHLGLKSV